MGIRHLGNEPHRVVTASLGVGAFHQTKDPDHVFEWVDAALYRAKAEGRNIIVVADLAAS
jgi:PleD family two-component response regulator